MKQLSFIIALLVSVQFAFGQGQRTVNQLLTLTENSHFKEQLRSVTHPNDYTNYSLRWNIAFNQWDSTSVTDVFVVDGANSDVDLHMYVSNYNGEGGLDPSEKLLIYGLNTLLVPNSEGELFDELNPAVVIADSMHNFFYNEDTKAFDLSLLVYLTPHANGQLETYQILLNGDLLDPPAGLLPFAENRYYYDQNDKLSGISSYFVNYYSLQLELEDSLTFSYDAQDRLILETNMYPNNGGFIMEERHIRYDNDGRYLNQLHQVMAGDTLLSQDSIARTYHNNVDFTDEEYQYNPGTMQYFLSIVTAFQMPSDTLSRETDLLPDGNGGLVPVYDFTLTYDAQQRLTTVTERSNFGGGPLMNDTREIYVYPATSSSEKISQTDFPAFKYFVRPGEGIECMFDGSTEGHVQLVASNGMMLSSREIQGDQHFIRMSGWTAGIYYLRSQQKDGAVRTVGFYWPG